MKRFIVAAAGLGSIVVLAAGLAWSSSQDGVDDFGHGPSGLVFGDSNSPFLWAVTTALEFRDVPDTGGGLLSNKGSRFLRVVARASDGDELRLIIFDYQCGDLPPPPMDPCSAETICSIGKGNKETCVAGQVVDFRKTAAVQATVLSRLIPAIVDEYGLDSETVLINTKLKEYAQVTGPVRDIDGVASFHAVGDLALREE